MILVIAKGTITTVSDTFQQSTCIFCLFTINIIYLTAYLCIHLSVYWFALFLCPLLTQWYNKQTWFLKYTKESLFPVVLVYLSLKSGKDKMTEPNTQSRICRYRAVVKFSFDLRYTKFLLQGEFVALLSLLPTGGFMWIYLFGLVRVLTLQMASIPIDPLHYTYR